jgi:glycosyltransferase involved in cell wall biosynthesis
MRIIANLTAINFNATLGVWHFGKMLLTAIREIEGVEVYAGIPEGTVPPADLHRFANGTVNVNESFEMSGACELLLHHFQKPISNKPYGVVIHDLHLWDVPWKYGAQEEQARKLCELLLGAAAVMSEFPRTYYDLHQFVPNIGNALFLLYSPTLREPSVATPADKAELLFRLGLRADQKYLLFPSQLQQHKNHVSLFKAFAHIAEVHPDVALICPGSDFRPEITSALRSCISELRLDERIIMPGYLSDADIGVLFRYCVGMVSPSLAEGGAYIAQEAIMEGKPFAISRIRSALMHLKLMGAEPIAFDPLDVDDVSAKLLLLLNSTDSNQIAKQVIAEWTWDKLARQVHEILTWVAQGKPSGAMPSPAPADFGYRLAGPLLQSA